MATIRSRGDKYKVQVRRTGQPQISKTFIHKRDAEVWARQMEVKADRYELIQGVMILKSFTLADLVERYLRTVSSTKKNEEWEKIVLGAFLRHPICKKRLSDLKSSDFASYRVERLASIKPKSLKRQLSPVHNLFEIARHEWGIPLKENPLDKVRISFTDNKRERRLEEGELERILDVTQGLQNPHVTHIIKLAVLTGMRRGEILGIKQEHIDVQRCLLRIPDSKNGRSRTIPLTDVTLALLKHSDESEDYVFPISTNAFRLAWERAKRKARITDLHFHDLRHEAISRFFEMGMTVPEVAFMSGHRDARMLLRYAHAQTEIVRRKLGR